MDKLIKWIVVLVVLALLWKFAVPKLQERFGRSGESEESVEAGCATAAATASETWGSGISRFVNPPYDIEGWSRFTNEVEADIRVAERQCGCSDAECTNGREAMAELRRLVLDLDDAIRSGTAPPDDIVRRQERVDELIEKAGE